MRASRPLLAILGIAVVFAVAASAPSARRVQAAEIIAFVSYRDGNAEIYAMRPNGTNSRRLTEHSAPDYDPDVSADGTRIVFTSNRDGNPELYVMNADGSGQTNISRSPFTSDLQASFSPTGAQIVFTQVTNAPASFELVRINADGSGSQNLTRTPGLFEITPEWSPDGSNIAFARAIAGNASTDIHLMSPTGTDVTRVTRAPDAEFEPAWSPDGRVLAFTQVNAPQAQRVLSVHARQPEGDDVHRVAVDGTGSRNITNTPGKDAQPDFVGSRIVFVSERSGDFELWAMNADGAGPVRLTESQGVDEKPAAPLPSTVPPPPGTPPPPPPPGTPPPPPPPAPPPAPPSPPPGGQTATRTFRHAFARTGQRRTYTVAIVGTTAALTASWTPARGATVDVTGVRLAAGARVSAATARTPRVSKRRGRGVLRVRVSNLRAGDRLTFTLVAKKIARRTQVTIRLTQPSRTA